MITWLYYTLLYVSLYVCLAVKNSLPVLNFNLLSGSRPDLSVSSKGWQSQQGINLPGQKSEPGNLSNSVASDQNIEAY